jgi:hypothetical protein
VVTTSIGGREGTPGEASASFAFELHSPDFHVPVTLADYVREKLAAKLAKAGRRLLGVVVRLRDLNGPKGGDGIACHMEAVLAGLEPVNVEERDDDLHAALDRAIECLDLVVQRHLGRARSLPRNRGRKLVRHSKLTG